MLNRQALEDAVFSCYPDSDMSDIEKMTTDKLQYLLDVKHGRKRIPSAKPKAAKTTSEKVKSTIELRNGELVHVETWRTVNAAGETVREYVQSCGDTVVWDGRRVSSTLVRHFLITGQWVKRIPKPKRYRAVIRQGRHVLHLGYFDSIEERDAAIFAHKIGLTH